MALTCTTEAHLVPGSTLKKISPGPSTCGDEGLGTFLAAAAPEGRRGGGGGGGGREGGVMTASTALYTGMYNVYRRMNVGYTMLIAMLTML